MVNRTEDGTPKIVKSLPWLIGAWVFNFMSASAVLWIGSYLEHERGMAWVAGPVELDIVAQAVTKILLTIGIIFALKEKWGY